jgi:flagellar basal body-associated protein FliL
VGIAVIALIILVVIAIIAIPILIRVFGEAARRSPNRPEGEGDDEIEERDRTSGPGRE